MDGTVEPDRVRTVVDAEMDLVCAERNGHRGARVYLHDFPNWAGSPGLVYGNDAERGKNDISLSRGKAVHIFDWRGGRDHRQMVKQDGSSPHRVVTLRAEDWTSASPLCAATGIPRVQWSSIALSLPAERRAAWDAGLT